MYTENHVETIHDPCLRLAGMVQKSQGQVAETRAERHERRGRGRRGFQKRIRHTIQRTHATVHRHGLAVQYRLHVVQQLGDQGKRLTILLQ